ncbi:MAG: hypothetical protein HY754_16005 [Nitrospirae bacterium]|nr:hypothetical protein [Nitrospirota bacterium]
MALEDIEKLKEKVAKDPNSKLFVPLAEEYRKKGMLDEAISVLLRGLDSQPGYTSARVALGKIYLEKKMINEAKGEFERVITAIPDNLFTHKKLAEIFRDSAEIERAIGEYKTVLKLNPLDEDAVSNLEELQNRLSNRGSTSGSVAGELSVGEAAVLPEAVEAGAEEVEVFPSVAEEETSGLTAEEDFEQFKKSMNELGEPEDIAAVEAIAEEIADEEIIPEEIITEDDIDISEAEKEALTYVDMFKETEAEVPKETTIEKIAASLETTIKESEPSVKKSPERKEDVAAYIKDAELFISGGNYSQALGIYRKILSGNPGDKHILQKVEELKMLLRMLGKEQEIVIGNLQAFAGGLKKRKDEFLGNS